MLATKDLGFLYVTSSCRNQIASKNMYSGFEKISKACNSGLESQNSVI